MRYSIIVCCYNSKSRIGAVINSLSRLRLMDGDGLEITVVDNNSSDDTSSFTASVAKELGVSISIIHEQKPGLSHARLAGVGASKGDVLVFCDDDNLLREDYVVRVGEIFRKHPTVVAVGGIGIPDEVQVPEWFQRYCGVIACGPQASSEGGVRVLYGAGLSIRRSAWMDLFVTRQFTSRLRDRSGKSLTGGGDTEICLALRLAGGELYYSPDLVFYHRVGPSRLTEGYLLRLAESVGEGTPVLRQMRLQLGDSQGFQRIEGNAFGVVILTILMPFRVSLFWLLMHFGPKTFESRRAWVIHLSVLKSYWRNLISGTLLTDTAVVRRWAKKQRSLNV